ncbi:hypothetical protein ACSRUE_06230 [Sorangium sp. KYC3313]|uniref:hypothetical protein n=1 Tax=Sorangium sp. KYC3313 TaxID=3449740 RepID=UPI003F8CD6DF
MADRQVVNFRAEPAGSHPGELKLCLEAVERLRGDVELWPGIGGSHPGELKLCLEAVERLRGDVELWPEIGGSHPGELKLCLEAVERWCPKFRTLVLV